MQFVETAPGRFRVNQTTTERSLAAALGGSAGEAAALALRRAVQLTLRSLTDETEILSVAGVYPAWAAGTAYAVGDIVQHGRNAVGDCQLYRVLTAHTAQADWLPGQAASLYRAIGVGEDGIPDWVKPLGAADAYQTGDVVRFEGSLWRSRIDGNVWSPTEYPAGWEQVQ